MNWFERLFGLRGEARLRYFDGEFQVLIPGDFVRCAVSGEPIALTDLRYWSVELQEAYATAEIAFARHRGLTRGRGRQMRFQGTLKPSPWSLKPDLQNRAPGYC